MYDLSINTSPQELKAVISKFDDPGTLAASGIMVGGMKYMYLSGRPGLVTNAILFC